MATQGDVARHLGVSQPAVSQLARDGVLPRAAGRGGYDIDACRLAYLEHLREAAAGRAGSATAKLSLADERASVAKEQADGLARRNAREAGELIEVGVVTLGVQRFLSSIRLRFLALPTKLAPRVASIKSAVEVQAVLEEAVRDVLQGLASTSPEQSAAIVAGELKVAPGPGWMG